MNHQCETAQSKIASPGVFRHTPYEHETTTDSNDYLTTIEPVTVTMVHPQPDDQTLVVQSLSTTISGR
jgi:hypothetical protein